MLTPSTSLPRQPVARLEGKSVCPFCGTITDTGEPDAASAPCPRCTLENTLATRQATKARIGPWYVLQSRNPAAPGMKYATLLALIQRGQVTPQSILRGPTTYQLWRFAAKVRGVSRQFGLCYACAGEIEPTTAICPNCHRSQEPPADPDTLLMPQRPAQKVHATIHRQVADESPPVDSPINAPVDVTSSNAAAETLEPLSNGQPTLPASPLSPGDEPLSTGLPARQMIERRGMTDLLSENPAAATAHRPGEEILTARELAAVFQLNVPKAPVKNARPAAVRRRHPLRNSVLVLLLLAILGGGTWLYFDAPTRDQAMNWAEQTYASAREFITDLLASPEPEDAGAASASHGGSTTAGSSSTSSASGTSGAVKAGVSGTTPAAAPVQPTVKPMNQPAVPPASTPAHTPSRTSANNPSRTATNTPAAAPTAVDAPRPNTSQSMEEAINTARQLWNKAITADGDGNYADAVRYYQQILQLPAGAQPGGIELRLKQAQERLQSQ